MTACAAIRHDTERLTCYDRATARAIQGESGGIDEQDLAPEALFGMPANSKPVGMPVRSELRSINAKVVALEGNARSGLHIKLDNGQLWRQEGSAELLLNVGDTVTISRAALSSFKISTPGERFARVRRVQ